MNNLSGPHIDASFVIHVLKDTKQGSDAASG